MVALLIWLAGTCIFLTDSHLLAATLGDRVSHQERQVWLGAPLLYAPLAFLFTPWRGWGVAATLLVLLVHLLRHLVWQRRFMGMYSRGTRPPVTAFLNS